MTGLIELDRRAVQRSIEIVDAVSIEKLEQSTPCSGWTLEDLDDEGTHVIRTHWSVPSAGSANVASSYLSDDERA